MSTLPSEVLLARGLPGHLECPVTANPPVTSVVWTKNDRVVAPLVPTDSDRGGDGGEDLGTRLTTDRRGSLLFRLVGTQDEGRYSCRPYSPLGVGQASRPVNVRVRGASLSLNHCCSGQFRVFAGFHGGLLNCPAYLGHRTRYSICVYARKNKA